jgi:alpha-tubulin suppressor-like RCC1 family protein
MSAPIISPTAALTATTTSASAVAAPISIAAGSTSTAPLATIPAAATTAPPPAASPVAAAPPPSISTSAGAGAGAGAGASALAAKPVAQFGEVFVSGSVAHSLTGRKDAPAAGGDGVPETNLYRFAHFSFFTGKKIVRIVASSVACHYIALDAMGGAYIWGRNERGQLGTGDLVNRYRPLKIELPGGAASVGFVDAAVGKSHTLLVTADGGLWAAGDNKQGQCGVGKDATFQAGTLLKWYKVATLPGDKKCTAVAAGVDFSLAVAGQQVFAAGSQQYGQCGSGLTGEYIVTAGKTAFKELVGFRALAGPIAAVQIVAIAAGANHGVALSVDGLPYTWGCGAYGRLGTAKPTDVLTAAPVVFFEPERLRAKSIIAGATVTYVMTRAGVNPLIYHFGITKKSGEATMKPAYIGDVVSMSCRALAVGPTSTILAADDTVVAWGSSPTSGELGFGEETKSSTKPKYVDDFEGTHAIAVSFLGGKRGGGEMRRQCNWQIARYEMINSKHALTHHRPLFFIPPLSGIYGTCNVFCHP